MRPEEEAITKWRITILLVLSSAGTAETLSIKARVFNQARVSQPVLVSAETEAAYALRTAAVEVRWVDCTRPGTCQQAIGPDEFEMLVRETAPSSSFQARGVEAMGQALLPVDQPGRYALAYFGEIRRLADRTTTISAGEILGYVIAHEIGHLLLGAHHQEGTIMQGEWGKVELQRMATRQLRFNDRQRADIRTDRMIKIRTRRDQALMDALLKER